MKNEIINGDALEVLKTLESESVDCCITSPPYWGLRDYGTEGQLGLEKTPEEYVENLVKVFREVKRVLKKEGTFWLNLGDSYTTNSSKVGSGGKESMGKNSLAYSENQRRTGGVQGLKEKNLVGIPWRVAFALQADGWYLRQDIIWAKPNPMPESVTDRCTKSHEYIFLLTKSPKYYYEQQLEPYTADLDRWGGEQKRSAIDEKIDPSNKANANSLARERNMRPHDEGRNKRSVWTINTHPYSEAHFATFPEKLIEPMVLAGVPKEVCNKCGKARENIRKAVGEKLDEESGVILDKSKPYAVVEREGYVEVRDLPPIKEIKEYLTLWRKKAGYTIDEVEDKMKSQSPHHWFSGESYPTKEDWLEVKELFRFDDTYDFQMTDITLKPAEKLAGEYKVVISDCGCNAGFSSGVVLDCFFGAGTTGVVAKKFGRNYLGIELNPVYVEIADKRLNGTTPPLF